MNKCETNLLKACCYHFTMLHLLKITNINITVAINIYKNINYQGNHNFPLRLTHNVFWFSQTTAPVSNSWKIPMKNGQIQFLHRFLASIFCDRYWRCLTFLHRASTPLSFRQLAAVLILLAEPWPSLYERETAVTHPTRHKLEICSCAKKLCRVK